MTREIFAGPIRSQTGFEIGSGDDAYELITSTGLYGSTANPGYFYGYAEGAFLGNAAFTVSTHANSTALDSVTSGYFQFFLLSDGTLVLKTSTGVLGTITIST